MRIDGDSVRMNAAKKTKLFFCVLLVVLATFACAFSLVTRGRSGEDAVRLFGSVDVGETGTATATMIDWETFTYANAPDFNETVFDGDDAFYYELDCGADEQYAMNAYVLSPALSFYPTDYTLEFQYFTRQRAATPNVLTVYASSDGETFSDCGKIECFDSGAETETWHTGEVYVPFAFRYLKLEWTVYYAGTGTERIEKSGLYLGKTFYLKAVKQKAVTANAFEMQAGAFGERRFHYEDGVWTTVDTSEILSLVYNGRTQYPDFTFTAPESGYVYEAYAEKDGVRTEPVASGTYDFCVAFYDDVNELICVRSFPYTIGKQTIELDSYKTVSNGAYIVLLDAVFKDGAGRSVSLEEAGCDRIYRTNADFNITVKNESFVPYTARLGRVQPDAKTSAFLYYLDNKDVRTVYDGTEKPIEDFLTLFDTYDFETGTFHTVTSGVSAEYYLGGEALGHAPRDAGTYDYRIILGSGVFEGTITVDPAPLTTATFVGTEDLTKHYDGNDSVAADGEIVQTLPEESIAFSFAPGDEVGVLYGSLSYARTTGKTYLTIGDIILTGADARNYSVGDRLNVDSEARILPTTLFWSELRDRTGDAVKIREREYDGTTEATIENTPTRALDMKGLGEGTVTYGDLEASLDKADSGRRTVTYRLINASLYDKYTEEIVTGASFATVQKRVLTAEASYYDGEEKVYDGTTDIEPDVYALSLGYVEDCGDGLNEAFATGEYAVYYESASFDSPEAGDDKQILVTNVTISGFDAEKEAIFANYIVREMTLTGRIAPKDVWVTTEVLRIFVGQSLPEVETTDGQDTVNVAVYATWEDAYNGVNRLPGTTRIAEAGDYYVKVTLNSSDYRLVSDGIIPLTITEVANKADGKIVVDAFDTEWIEELLVPLGGRLPLEAYVADEYGRKTGREIDYDTTGNVRVEDGIAYFDTEGDFTVTLRCFADSYYNETEPLTIRGSVRECTVSTSISGGSSGVLYAGDAVPTGTELEGNILFTYLGKGIEGTLEGEDRILIAGERAYDYTFTQKEYFDERTVDLTIRRAVYEYDEQTGAYRLTTDETYDDQKIYYLIDAEESLDADVVGLYEKIGDDYVPTEDAIAQDGKTYYALTVNEDTSNLVTVRGYYTLEEGAYVETPVGSRFVAGTTYYGKKKDFYGETGVKIFLTAEKPMITLVIGGETEVPYGTAFDIRDVILAVKYEGMYVPLREMQGFDVSVSVWYYVEREAEGQAIVEAVNSAVNPAGIGVYTIGEDAGVVWTGYAQADGEYDFTFGIEGNATFTVTKSRVTVYSEPREKYYYAERLTEENLKSGLVLEGSVREEDRQGLLAMIAPETAASQTATVGDYNILCFEKETEESDALKERYELVFRNAYLTVIPTPMLLTATTPGHVYGEEMAEIVPSATVIGASLQPKEREEVQRIVREHTVCRTSATADSDVGGYPIDIEYLGDVWNFDLTFEASEYSVTPATITGVFYDDETILYDGGRHTLEVTYDEDEWQDLTIRYNNGYFTEPGVYEYVATVSKKNYYDMRVSATLTIGTLRLTGSSTDYNAVAVQFSQSEYNTGLNPYIVPKLEKVSDDSNLADVEKMLEKASKKKYEVKGVYDVTFLTDGTVTRMGQGDYEVSFKPSDISYSSGIKIFGYDASGSFGELEYTYENGTYTVKTGLMKNMTLVTEKLQETNKLFLWAMVVIIALVALILIAFLFGGGKKRRRQRMRSRKRHSRWA